MKWHEIQGAEWIDLETKGTDFHKRRFRVDLKDLLGALVEIQTDGTIELVYLMAKL